MRNAHRHEVAHGVVRVRRRACAGLVSGVLALRLEKRHTSFVPAPGAVLNGQITLASERADPYP